jgi:hypothetical protein
MKHASSSAKETWAARMNRLQQASGSHLLIELGAYGRSCSFRRSTPLLGIGKLRNM